MLMIRHPLVFAVPFLNCVEYVEMLNKSLEYKMKAINKAEQEGDWHRYVWMHERPYRLYALIELQMKADKLPADLVADVYIDSENIWQNIQEWSMVLADFKHLELCNKKEKLFIKSLPNKVDIYRGTNREMLKKRGTDPQLSWTLNKKRAIWFASRHAREDQVLLHMEIDKKDIFQYFSGRGEEEVLTHPYEEPTNYKEVKICVTI